MNNDDYINIEDLLKNKTPEISFIVLFMEIKTLKSKIQEIELFLKDSIEKKEELKNSLIELERKYETLTFKTETRLTSLKEDLNESKERALPLIINNSDKPNVILALFKLLTDYKEVALYVSVIFIMILSSILGGFELLFEQKKDNPIPSIRIEEGK
jgi:hypothetical protein